MPLNNKLGELLEHPVKLLVQIYIYKNNLVSLSVIYIWQYMIQEELFEIKSRFGNFPDYRITKSGRVFSYRQGNVLKPLSVVLDDSGYPIVRLYYRDGIKKFRTIAVHRLVADTFIPNPNNYSCINHKDENKVNNSVDNLEWCTQLYNNIYRDKAKKIGLKLRDSNPRKKAVQQILDGKVINTFKSIREAARFLGDANKDANIVSGLKTGNPRYGYIWKYVTI